jgi:hypothetical protein
LFIYFVVYTYLLFSFVIIYYYSVLFIFYCFLNRLNRL